MAKEIPVVPSALAGSAGEVSAAPSWREYRPQISDQKAIDFKVVLYCPDGAISLEGEQFVINYKYCKGCGICAKESRGIDMVPEYAGPQGILKLKGVKG